MDRAMMLNRRQLLRTGSLALAGLGLPELLWADRNAGERRLSEKSCIFIVQYGGASQIDTLDPKPDAVEEIRSPYRPIATATPGMQITEMLPRLALQSRHFCLVRSMTHAKSVHFAAMDVCLTGQSNPLASMPTFGAVVSRLKPAERGLPSHVWIQDLDRDVSRDYMTGGTLGNQYGPMLIATRDNHYAAPGFRVTAFDAAEGVTHQRQEGRVALLRRLESGTSLLDRPGPRNLEQFQEQALELTRGAGAARAFDINREPERVRDQYGRGPFGQNLLAARRLIEAGVRLVSINAWCGYPQGEEFISTQGWDCHGAASQKGGIFSNTLDGLGFVLPRFDQALSALLEDLHQRGLLETTLVVVVGEFGRTPRISRPARSAFVGRDHWPQCYSALLAGGGVRGGTIWGSSDRQGGYVRDKAVTPEDFTASIYHALGINTEARLSLGTRLPIINGHAISGIFE
jgi:hypothetical protein